LDDLATGNSEYVIAAIFIRKGRATTAALGRMPQPFNSLGSQDHSVAKE
jgi:hypothetical protein